MSEHESAGTVEDNLELVTFIQMTRLYDVMMALLQETNPEKAATLHALHAQGDFITAPPALAEAPDDEANG